MVKMYQTQLSDYSGFATLEASQVLVKEMIVQLETSWLELTTQLEANG